MEDDLGGLFAGFGMVRIINLVDRADRKREMAAELAKARATSDNIGFFPAQRPADKGAFPSLGARGCFESHLAVLREARDAGVSSLLLLEDDITFVRGGIARGHDLLPRLAKREWDFFYGAHKLAPNGREGLAPIGADEPLETASFVAFDGQVLEPLIAFLELIRSRPSGSSDYGPMHVDGAYAVFRSLNPHYRCLGAFPTLARQRSSRSDITPTGMFLDRYAATRGLADGLRRLRNRILRG